MFGYILLVIFWVILIIKNAKSIGKSIFSSESDQTKIIVFTGLIVLGVAYFYRMIHLGIYYTNGKGIAFFDGLYIILKSSCEFIIVTTLVAIGWGWSIIHLKHDQSYILAGLIATLINISGLIVNLAAEELAETHHKYDSTSGYLLQILRLLIFVLFTIGALRTLSLSAGSIKRFVKKLGLVGGIYLLSWPLVVLFA